MLTPQKLTVKTLLSALCGLAAFFSGATAQDLYWTVNGPQIMGANLDGTGADIVFDGTGMIGTAVDVAVTADYIYWTDKSDSNPNGGVWRAKRNGDEAALFIANPDPETMTSFAPQFIEIDEEAGKLYFSDWITGLYSADLATGENVEFLGNPHGGEGNANATGLAARGADQLLSTNAAGGDTNLYSTVISTRTHSIVQDLLPGGDHQQYGLAFDEANDIVYFTSLGAGTLSSLDLQTGVVTPLLSDLGTVLGVELSASGTHLVYLERTGNKISAYEIATGEIIELVTGADLGGVGLPHFGVGIFGDPGPLAPGTVVVHDDFSAGTIGNQLHGNLPIEGKGQWRHGAARHAVYGGTEENKTFLTSGSGLSYMYLDTDVDSIENYSLVLNNVSISTGVMDGGSSFLFGTRRAGIELGWAYDFRPVVSGANPEVRIWEVTYIRAQADPQRVVVGQIHQRDLELDSLELRVRGNWAALYIDGERFDQVSRPTQATALDGTIDYAFHVGLNSTPADTLTLEFDELTLTVSEAPEPAPLRHLFAYDGFDYQPGDLVGQDGGLGWAQPWAPSTESRRTDWPFAQVTSPGQSAGELLAEGNKAYMAEPEIPGGNGGGRAFRYIDVDNLDPSFVNSYGTIGVPGTSIWVSFIAEGNSDDLANGEGDPNRPFWGISLFSDASERLFFGKSTGGQELRVSGQGQALLLENNEAPIGEKHFVAIRLDFNEEGGHSASLFINPDPTGRTPSEENAYIFTGTAVDFSFNRVRVASGGGYGGTIDELRIGAAWMDVTPIPYDGFANGDLEAEPFAHGWSLMRFITPHPGLIEGSATAAFIPVVSGSGQHNWPILSQHRPSKLEVDTVGADRSYLVQPTGPKWQVGFYTALGDAAGEGDRSLSLGIGGERPADYTFVNAPAINFRVTGTGAGQVFHGQGEIPPPAAWHEVFPAGTFTESAHTDQLFENPTVYYIQFDGDYTTSPPSYTISVEEVGGSFSAVSEPLSFFQYVVPEVGSGIITTRFNGVVQAPYVVDDIHMISVGDSVPAGYAEWVAEHELDGSQSGMEADPDGDGIENLLEYALGSDPLAPSVFDLPIQSIVNVGGEDYLTLTFTRPVGIAGVDYVVEESADLVDWDSGPVELASSVEDGLKIVTYRDSMPMTENERRFLRLRVVAQE